MKKIVSTFLVALLCFSIASTAQVHVVTGTVKDDQGAPIPSASVKIKGTNTATVSDQNGSFRISANESSTLVFSAVGFTDVEVKVGKSTTLNVGLSKTTNELENVVVTAQGIRKRPRELGYAVSKVSNEELTVGRAPQVGAGLSGKVSGLTIFNMSNSVDPAYKFVLRGYRSINGKNDALIVIDGVPMPQPPVQDPSNSTGTSVAYPNVLNLLNPNDIESISVMKGGQAATLYGSDGVNGAILITTKKGTKGKKARVTYSNATNFERVSFLPEFQDKYGSGSHYAASFGTSGWKPNYLDRMKDNWKSYENQQFGDQYDGSSRPAGRVLQDGSVLTLPYSAIEGERMRIWDNGFSTNNQVSVSGGSEISQFYLSLENNVTKGVLPGDQSGRTGARFSGSTESGKFKVGYNLAYVQQNFDRSTFDFYNESINQAAHIPLSSLRDWRNNKFASPDAYYNDYYTNPYFRLDNQRQNYKDANIQGVIEMTLKANNWLTFYNRFGLMNNNRIRKNVTGKYIYSTWAKTQAYVPAPFGSAAADGLGITRTATDIPGSVYDASSGDNVITNDLQAQFNKGFGDFSAKGFIGFNMYDEKTKFQDISSSSIVVPGINNVANRQGVLGGGEENTEYRKYGYYIDGTLSWKDMVYLHGTGRYDATSKFYKPTRQTNQYSYPYFGFDVSAVVTDLLPSIKGKILSYAKLRAGYNKNGNDNIALYGLDPSYSNASGFPFGNVVGVTVGDVLPDSALRPEIVKSFEVGGEFQFFDSRLSLDVSYYDQNSTDQVVTVRVPNTTGYSSYRVNVGQTKNWGYELDLRYQAVRGKKFTLDLNARYSFNDNKVVDLYPSNPNVTDFQLAGYSYASAYIVEGQSFPTLRAVGYVRDPASGRVMVNRTTGYPINNGPLKDFGRTIPKDNIGFGARMRYTDFSLAFNFEYRGGNMIYSDLGRQMTFTGSGKWTEDRAPHIFPNSAYDDGTGKIVPNTTVNTAEAEYALWDTYYKVIAENFVTPGWFIKLRDVNLSYSLPASLIAKTRIFSAASIGVYGRNLITIVDKTNYYTDPEFSFTTGNGQGINNTTQTPPVRQLGFNLNLTF